MYESLDHIRYFLLSAVLLTESVGPGLIVDPDILDDFLSNRNGEIRLRRCK